MMLKGNCSYNGNSVVGKRVWQRQRDAGRMVTTTEFCCTGGSKRTRTRSGWTHAGSLVH